MEYFGKKGMSLLGSMITECVIKKEKEKVMFKYTFVDYVVKGYTGQNNVQVAAILNLIVNHIHRDNPQIKEICIQSDNATCFSSQDFIPYIAHLNEELDGIKIAKWIFTEAQTGRGCLDTHFSYINIWLKSYVEDGFNVTMEEDIVKALSHRGGIAGTTAVLVDATTLHGTTLNKPFHCHGIGARETHEIVWNNDEVEVIASSGISTPIIVSKEKLDAYAKNKLCPPVDVKFSSSKDPMVVEALPRTPVVKPVSEKSSKIEKYEKELHLAIPNTGIKTYRLRVRDQEVKTPRFFFDSWAVYPGNTTDKMCQEVLCKLSQLYQVGHVDKKRKISPDRALHILIEELIYDDWAQQVVISVPRIKAFFSMTPEKQKVTLEQASPLKDFAHYKELVQNIEQEEIHNETIDNDVTLQDVEIFTSDD